LPLSILSRGLSSKAYSGIYSGVGGAGDDPPSAGGDDGADGAGDDPGVTGAVGVAGVGTLILSNAEVPLMCLEAHVRYKHVSMNVTAAAIVNLANGPAAPRAPNIVFDAPPKTAPTSAPLPACKSTDNIMTRQTTT